MIDAIKFWVAVVHLIVVLWIILRYLACGSIYWVAI